MATATGQYNSVTPSNVLVGFATLWVAPNLGGLTPEPIPADTILLGQPWGGNWTTPGATETGVTWSVDEKDTNIMIEEQPNPVDVIADTQDYMFEATLVEDTIQNMLLAYGRGTVASQAQSGGRVDASCGTTSGSTSVTDPSITAADAGKSVTGTGIPAGATIVTVVVGTSFTLSAAATATGTAVSLTIGGTTVGKNTLTFSIVKNKYSFGLEGVNTHGYPRRIYIPTGVVVGSKVDTAYQRAKAARMYKTTFQAICPPTQIVVVDYTS